MRAVFFGTPQFAVPCLEALGEIAEITAVVCQPDKPQGRGLELTAPPVKARALESDWVWVGGALAAGLPLLGVLLGVFRRLGDIRECADTEDEEHPLRRVGSFGPGPGRCHVQGDLGGR